MVFREQQQPGPAAAVQIAGRERVRVQQPVLQRPAFRRAPAVRALVELHDQFLRFPVVGNVRLAVSIQVGHHQAGNPLFRSDGINPKTGVGRQFIQLAFPGGFHFGLVRLAGLIVKQVDL